MVSDAVAASRAAVPRSRSALRARSRRDARAPQISSDRAMTAQGIQETASTREEKAWPPGEVAAKVHPARPV